MPSVPGLLEPETETETEPEPNRTEPAPHPEPVVNRLTPCMHACSHVAMNRLIQSELIIAYLALTYRNSSQIVIAPRK